MKDSRIRTAVVILALILAVASVVLVTITSADAASIQRGSSGDTVKQVQQRLKAWGYYSGCVDGIYGSKTEAAVSYFQRKNGLTVDGKAGPQTLAAMGIAAPSAVEVGPMRSMPPGRATEPSPRQPQLSSTRSAA